MDTSIQIHHRPPSSDDYVRLRKIAGMSERTKEAAEIGLKNSLFAVTVTIDEKTVGIGRIVGDGGCNFEIVDVVVDPECQGKGIGTLIMEELLAYLEEHTPKSAFVSMIADPPGQKMYQKLGFKNAAPSIGMYKRY
ncbi:GNAT family N-acetyltransferase [Pseudalkalibacillus caeni]|uniref:GNAT family N-acetyltransferase n=1 Tax=Exobacillus caeni TaxID=2574798 RepID=A0A5R9F6G0_9BACL|nr:GNAT family N-acetyltransferase [Pseudalkalibacillus caeni]TLS36064.1 GNAT family N-acetyltransferase [Pseudalkalibacillus caeni]